MGRERLQVAIWAAHLRGHARGSALILAVVLLVLMALVGIAFLTTTRNDRYASYQHTSSTQADLLLDGVVTLVETALVDDLFDGATDAAAFRRPGMTYEHVDGEELFLAARVPAWDAGTYRWPTITAPILGGPFVSPDGANQIVGRNNPAPTSITHNGRKHPALDFGAGGGVIRAADTDGDGVADAGLWPLPVSSGDGLRWYAAVRIIDNNSALNLATASRRAGAVEGEAPSPIFPTHADLETLLHGTPAEREAQIIAFNDWRGGGVPVGTSVFGASGQPRTDLEFSSEAEALWMQLGRRVDRPGLNGIGCPFRAVPVSDALGLAFPFGVRARTPMHTTTETLLTRSLIDGVRSGPFPPDEPSKVGGWGDTQFGYQREPAGEDAAIEPAYSVRALVTTRNPLSNTVAVAQPLPPVVEGMAPDPVVATKTSLNTAGFPELWRAFRDVMSEAGGTTPFSDNDGDGIADAGREVFNPYDVSNPQRMFRSSLRDVRYPDGKFDAKTVRFPPEQQLLLRAALAAVNALDLRDADADVTARSITLSALVDGKSRNVDVTVYGTEPQPFITEIFASSDNGAEDADGPNPRGYIAVELHNPYAYDLPLTNYQLGVIDRGPQPQGKGQKLRVQPLRGFNGFDGASTPVPVIPANGYLVLENYVERGSRTSDDAMAARFRPSQTGLSTYGDPGGTSPDGIRRAFVYVRGLHDVLQSYGSDGTLSGGGELVVLRPRRADGVAQDGERVSPNGAWNLHELVPVDQHDFAGVGVPLRHRVLGVGGGTTVIGDAVNYHYARTNGGSLDAPNFAAWRFVFPGRYDGSKSSQRHEGAVITKHAVGPVQPGDPERPFFQMRLGDRNPAGSYPHAFPAVQLNNADFGGPNRTRDAVTGAPLPGPHRFPYGAFMRAGDVLQVPFIGAYRVRVRDETEAAILLEMNAVTTDSAFADDGDPTTDPAEHLGRFCPLKTAEGPAQVDDYDPAGSYAPTKKEQKGWRYRWALDVIDRFCTIANPADDYLPNVDPSAGAFPGTAPEPVANDASAVANTPGEALAPVEGLVNVNTAPWPVLAALHLAPGATPAQQEALARAIVRHRAKHGPFRSLMELNAVRGEKPTETFATGWGTLDLTKDFDDAAGDHSPAGPTLDGIVGDFEQQFLMVNRASNLLSTRSDSFTCYLVLEGWREGDSAGGEPTIRRRAAVVLDRSRVTPDRSGMRRLHVPAE